MIISTEVKKPLYSLIEYIENTVEDNVQTAFTFHGTSFFHKNSKHSFISFK